MSETLSTETEIPNTETTKTDHLASEGAPETETTTESPGEERKPSQKERRFAHLTAKLGDASRRAEMAEAELRAMRELVAARTEPGAEPPKQAQAPTQDAVRAEAARLLEQERLTERRTSLIGEGVKELGEEVWNEKTSILHEFGATNNDAFMQAITELPGGAKIVAALADDVDQLAALLKKSPTALAAHLGRMSAQFEAAPKRAPASNAPKPITPVAGNARAEADPSKMSMKEYAAWRAKNAPRALGGQGKKS